MRDDLANRLGRYLQDVVEPNAGLMAVGRGPEPAEVVAQAGAYGLAGLLIPVELGGGGGSYLEFAEVIEKVAEVCASTAVILDVHASVAVHPLLQRGTAEQKGHWLPRMATGEAVGAFALTEPGAGSDAGAGSTEARPAGSGWSITGNKLFITNCGAASAYVVLARTGGKGPSGLSAFIVEGQDPGVGEGRRLQKMGLHGSWTGELLLEAVPVSSFRLLGAQGDGFRIAMEALDVGRVGIAAQAVGIARGALALLAARPGPGVENGSCDAWCAGPRIAELATRIEAAWQLTASAARSADAGETATFLASAAKLLATDTAMCVTSEVVDILGVGAGFGDHPAAVRFCDAKACQIYEGTNQIQRIVIARELQMQSGIGR